MRFLSWIIGLPVTVAAIVFAVSNRHGVAFDLWPFPFTVDAPVWLAVLLPLAFGLVLGGLIGWSSAAGARSEARSSRRRARDLERQVETLRRPANDSDGKALIVSGNGASRA